MPGKPKADKGMKCPLFKKDLSQVCHTCEFYQPIRGKNPQSEQIIDQWGCTIKWFVLVGLEQSQQQRSTAAAIESFRNVMVALHGVSLDQLGAGDAQLLAQQRPPMQVVKELPPPSARRLPALAPPRPAGVTVRLSDKRVK